MSERIISRFEGRENGPLLICIGGMHGNELSGIQAIKQVFDLLEYEPEASSGFHYRGVMVGIRGNLAALQAKKRFINRDLNRMLTAAELGRIQLLGSDRLADEDKECLEVIEAIEAEKKRYAPSFTLILDLHTTTADGGVFTIAAEDEKSKALAKGLHAPVVLGIAERLTGTTINYFNQPDSNCYCIVFEAGQQEDPQAIHRSVAAIVNCMRNIGSVDPHMVDHKHDGMLISFSKGLPKVSRLVFHYKIKQGEQFVMNPGFQNFQSVAKGDQLARNEKGNILSPRDGLILMPKYQAQGEDGFFIVEPVEL